ncbi:MAG: 16S rRNA (guanine(966)-N(2))-methyltransferase RsmD, partial [Actinobacteria bacterium]
MRIVAGAYRGRRIEAPPGTGTRPTTDRVREALFSALVSVAGPDLGGGAVLDAFGGSGALGLEALSRGAGPVTFV